MCGVVVQNCLRPGNGGALRVASPSALAQNAVIIPLKAYRRDVVAQSSSLATSSTDINVDLSIHNCSYEDGIFSITGKLIHPAVSPELAYSVLTDYDALPRVFHNVEDCSVRWDEGGKHLVQSCNWRFLVFKGSFVTELTVVEEEELRQLEFSLRKSAFMRKFVGSWSVLPATMGGSEIWHSMAVQPALAPPKRIGELTKKIFVSQVEGILGDLAVELHRRSVDLE